MASGGYALLVRCLGSAAILRPVQRQSVRAAIIADLSSAARFSTSTSLPTQIAASEHSATRIVSPAFTALDGTKCPIKDAPTTNKLEFIDPTIEAQVPTYRILGHDGNLLTNNTEASLDVGLSENKILELYLGMLRLNIMDKIMFDSHRQGKITFYMTSFGEEAVQFGSAGGLEAHDWIYAQYREAGLLLHRGMELKLMMAQCYGNKEDLGKGRQMPIHYGNKGINYVTISSTLATQMPQAVGSAYALKRSYNLGQNQKQQVVACYFGEGASSEGDAHAAMNFAATLDCPVIFICRNNGYAISTPASEQYRGDGLVSRALGYGISAIRVDGNDLFAVYMATKEARRICASESRPILIEAMTYRVGHHSTSDDSTAYRSVEEIRAWEAKDNPIERVYKYLLNQGLWSEQRNNEFREQTRAQIFEALNWAAKVKKLPVTSMFDDVYNELPANLRRQRDELRQHLKEFGQHYPISEHEGI